MVDINNRKELNKLGYNSNIYYCGNYSMEKYYSLLYNYLKKKGVKFPLNRACFLHDLEYSKKPNLKQKISIDFRFYKNMQKCIIYEYQNNNLNLCSAFLSRFMAMVFYFIVIICTPLYVLQGKIKVKK